jgi:hypothetical protein
MPSWPGEYRYDPPSSRAIQTEAEDAASAQDKGPARSHVRIFLTGIKNYPLSRAWRGFRLQNDWNEGSAGCVDSRGGDHGDIR